ncbi:MAG TPA: cation:proton antiporter [Oligoflexia bacterium]|nr:cation:proton antiporter [Oligoflexia bacterium]HMP47344.1 cation:proton antiporter [Oligoflexia bacterium]
MLTLALLLLAASASHFLSVILRVPAIPVLILSGLSLTASGIIEDKSDIHNTLLLGLTFLVFLAGTELNPGRIGRYLPAAIKVGLFQFISLGFASFIVAKIAGLGLIQSFYIGLAIAASSTLVVVRILQRRRQFFEPFGRLVLGVLLVQDGIAIFFISLLPAITASPHVLYSLPENSIPPLSILKTPYFFLTSLGALICLGIISYIFQTRIASYFFVRLRLDEEALLLVSLAVLFVFAFLAKLLNIHFIVGAFFGGFALSSFPVRGIVNSQLLSIADFFVAIFFVAIGATLILPTGPMIVLAILLILLVILLTPLIVLFISESARITTRSALEAGLLLAQTSEFSLIIGLIGYQSGHLDQSLLGLIALITVTTMMLTPFIATNSITWGLTKLIPNSNKNFISDIPDKHIIVLGCGESILELILQFDETLKKRLLVVDYDPGVLSQLSKEGILTLRGDAADPFTLNACRATEASFIISTLGKIEDNEKILTHVNSIKVYVRVQESDEARRIERKGGIPILSSALSANALMTWISGKILKPVNLQRQIK